MSPRRGRRAPLFALAALALAVGGIAACADDGGISAPTGPATTLPPTTPPTSAPPTTAAPPPATAPPTTTPPATAPPTTAVDDLAARAFGVEDAADVIAEAVEFPGSALETLLSGAVVRAERVVYFVEGEVGWLLTARIAAIEDNAVFDIYAPTGELLVSEATQGHALVAEPGQYQIVVGGTRGNATYDLAVGLSPAQVVRFPAGATGTTITGTVPSGARLAYILGATAGQTMSLAVTSEDGSASLAVLAPSGELLDTLATTSRIELPESGDYVLLVGSSPGAATFELEITIV